MTLTAERPARVRPVVLEGRHVRLEPLELGHAGALLAVAGGPRETYGFTTVPADEPAMLRYIETALRDQETSSLATYVGGWSRVVSTGALGGYVKYKSAAGATASYTFTGRAIGWVAPRSSSRGSATIYIDGGYVATVSLYRSSTLARYSVYRTSWLTSGTHTIKIVVVGTAGHPRIDVDAFTVLR